MFYVRTDLPGMVGAILFFFFFFSFLVVKMPGKNDPKTLKFKKKNKQTKTFFADFFGG